MTDLNKLKLKNYAEFIQSRLNEYVCADKNTAMQKTVIEAMNYSLSAGGKRIRPVLLMEFNRICGGSRESAAAAACAIEMIHTFSLIHDDLPCMDDDDFRRGRPSCHKQFGEAEAVLAGDALSVLPFEIIAEDKNISDVQKVGLISELSHATGFRGMIGGQIIDIENEKRSDTDIENLKNMYAHKTGALIKSACRMGCICAGADEAAINLAGEYAEKIGLAFQIVDDILDVTSTQEVLGKPIGSDAQQNKTTFVTLMGIENAAKQAEILTNQALALLENFNDNEFLCELTDMLLSRKN